MSKAIRVESGDARITSAADGSAILNYHFAGTTQPIVLRIDFDFPCKPDDLHKLMIAMRPDDSWNRLSISLDVSGRHWDSAASNLAGTTSPDERDLPATDV